MCHSAKIAGVRVEIEAREGIEVRVEIVRREIEGHVRREVIDPREIVRREIEGHVRREVIDPREIVRREIEGHALPGQWVIGPRVHPAARDPLRVRRRRVPQLPARP